jgi:hypothetical protein
MPSKRIGDRFQLPNPRNWGKDLRGFRPHKTATKRTTHSNIQHKPMARFLSGIEREMVMLTSARVEV